MDRITINGSTSYDVIIEQNILSDVGSILCDELSGNKAIVISDSNVAALYLGIVSDSLREAGYEVSSLTLTPGEETKNIDNYVMILNLLADHRFAKSDLIIALGGGSIGDLAGFVAATYKRGTKFVQIPTTLLAAVDSSIGGKSAVNLPAGKNQVGTIKNPSIVICDPEVIHTLSHDALLDGYAEIIKYGILDGIDIIELLRDATSTDDYSKVIAKAIYVKRSYVEKDENDADSRQFLNLGHLIGHAIEAASDYSISHGKAVATGLALESKCCALFDLCDMNVHLEIVKIIQDFGFDTSINYAADDLLPYLLHDKRIREDKIRIVVPISFGNCEFHELQASDLSKYISIVLR